VGIPWRGQTVDRIVAGSPDTPVKGIATTMIATLDVIERAAAAGRNLVITHEPTFYSHQDTVDQLASDATYQFKLDFMRRNNMVSSTFTTIGMATSRMESRRAWRANWDGKRTRTLKIRAYSPSRPCRWCGLRGISKAD
jgi:uncharacterized UPF0160 family protein